MISNRLPGRLYHRPSRTRQGGKYQHAKQDVPGQAQTHRLVIAATERL